MPLELLSLPIEIVKLILDHVPRQDLRQLSLVAGGLRDICQPILFRHVKQPVPPFLVDGVKQPWSSTKRSYKADEKPQSGHSVRDLLRLVVRRPELGQSIRSMLIWAWKPAKGTADLDESQTTDAHIISLEKDLWAGVITEELFEGKDEKGKQRASVAHCKDLILLLSLTQALESLVMDLPSLYTGSFLDRLLRIARCSSAPTRLQLPSLSNLEIDYPSLYLDYGIQDIAALLELPSLTTFRGHWLTRNPNKRQYYIGANNSLSIAHLNLVCGILDNDGICTLLRECQALQTFRLIYGRDRNFEVCHLDFDAISEALQGHRTTLQSLTIDGSPENGIQHDIVQTWGQIDLHSFTQLKHVELPSWALTGPSWDRSRGSWEACHCDVPIRRDTHFKELTDILPPVLEKLIMRNSEAESGIRLYRFAKENPELGLPALRSIVNINSHWFPMSDDKLELLRQSSSEIYHIENAPEKADHTGFNIRFRHRCGAHGPDDGNIAPVSIF